MCQKDLKKTSSRPQKGFNLLKKNSKNRRKERPDKDYQNETQIYQNYVVESRWNVWIQCADDMYLYKYYEQLHSALCTFEKGGRRGAHAIHGSFYEPRFFSYLFCVVLKKRRPDCLVVVDNLFRTLWKGSTAARGAVECRGAKKRES